LPWLVYVCVKGAENELRVFRREMSKHSEWSLYEDTGALFVARRDAPPNEDAAQAENRTRKLLEHLNFALMLEGFRSLSDLTTGGTFVASADGRRSYTIVAEGVTYRFNAEPVLIQVSGAPGRDNLKLRVTALQALPATSRILTMLRLFADERERWGSLYNIVELARAELNSEIPKDWISGKRLELFERTANDHRASDLTARHLTRRTEPPANPMALDEAQALIRDLIGRVIDHRS